LTGLAFEAKAMDVNLDNKQNELQKFVKFLDKNQAIEADLKQNPQLINDSQYLANHRQLQEFIRKHPHIGDELRDNPNYFMNREKRYEKHEKKVKNKHHWWHRW
jgi:hypothetical protein